MSRYKVGLEVSYWRSSGVRGIGNMTSNVASNLVGYQDFKFFFYSNRRDKEIENFCHANNIQYCVIPLPFPFYEQIAVPIIARVQKMDLFQYFGNTGSIFMKPARHSIITICDTIYWEQSIWQWMRARRWGNIYRSIIVRIQARCKYSYTFISYYARTTYLNKMPSPKLSKVIYLSGGGDNPIYTFDHCDGSPYLCCMGALDPRKNTFRVIHEYINTRIYKKYGMSLIVFGLSNVDEFKRKHDLNAKYLTSEGVSLLGYLDEQQKLDLLMKCSGFIYLSTSEGFGIPIVEAEKMGKCCLVSETTSCGEISSSFAIKVDPHSAASVSEGIEQLASTISSSDRGELGFQIAQYSAKYSWKNTARSLIKFYRVHLLG